MLNKIVIACTAFMLFIPAILALSNSKPVVENGAISATPTMSPTGSPTVSPTTSPTMIQTPSPMMSPDESPTPPGDPSDRTPPPMPSPTL